MKRLKSARGLLWEPTGEFGLPTFEWSNPSAYRLDRLRIATIRCVPLVEDQAFMERRAKEMAWQAGL